MKPRTLASIGAVLLYLWCEFFQASPFAFLEERRETAAPSASGAFAAQGKDVAAEAMAALFVPGRLAQ